MRFITLFKHFSGFEFFLLPSRVHARNVHYAKRWHAPYKTEVL
jgi:hypothetical protein